MCGRCSGRTDYGQNFRRRPPCQHLGKLAGAGCPGSKASFAEGSQRVRVSFVGSCSTSIAFPHLHSKPGEPDARAYRRLSGNRRYRPDSCLPCPGNRPGTRCGNAAGFPNTGLPPMDALAYRHRPNGHLFSSQLSPGEAVCGGGGAGGWGYLDLRPNPHPLHSGHRKAQNLPALRPFPGAPGICSGSRAVSSCLEGSLVEDAGLRAAVGLLV